MHKDIVTAYGEVVFNIVSGVSVRCSHNQSEQVNEANCYLNAVQGLATDVPC